MNWPHYIFPQKTNTPSPIMSDNTSPIPHLTRSLVVPIDDGKVQITVQEMTWLDMLAFLKLLSQHAKCLIDDVGRLSLDINKIVEIITGAQELSNFLIAKSSTIQPEQLHGLSFVDGLALLDAALELNLTEEVMTRAKKTVGRFGALLGLKPARISTPSSSAATSSSGAATVSTPSPA
jgi:hypothetical protein